MVNLIAAFLFLLAVLCAALGVFGVAIAHLEFWTLGFIALGLLVDHLGGYIVTRP